jgi:single-strand DNA-binding protein
VSSVNKCIFVGRLGRDPEVRNTNGGKQVVNFSIAVDHGKGDEKTTEWVNLVAFGKLAEICGKYLTKGKQIYAEGRMQTRSWDDKKTGEKKYRTEVVLNEMQMLGGKNDGAPRSSTPDDFAPPDADDFAPPSESNLPF